jgi:hypothetical protein
VASFADILQDLSLNAIGNFLFLCFTFAYSVLLGRNFAACCDVKVKEDTKISIMASTTASAPAKHATAFNQTLRHSPTTIPWYIWCSALAVTSAMIGAYWDISWHESIGRDAFWTPAHIAIYICGALAGVAFGYLILTTTFVPTSPLRDVSVRIWGFRGPLGAFIASWGGIAMLTSAPFDNWWHAAYGLDVKIISPPHILLFIGVYGVILGTMVLIAAHANRAQGRTSEVSRWLFLYVASIWLILIMAMLMEYTERPALHIALPYIAMSCLVPLVLSGASRATGLKFAATCVAGIYTLVIICFIQILPLFPAQPKLGPVYQQVTHFVPPEFPILLIVPALALDLLWSRSFARTWNQWALAAVSGVVFLGLLIAIEWPFATFLMSPAARNRFFATMYLYFALPPTSFSARNLFYPIGSVLRLLQGLGIALAASVITFRWGFSRGDWMRLIQR